MDVDWLEDFHAGKHPLKPRDALRVRIRIAHTYDRRGDLLEADETIVKVFFVIEGEGDDELLI
jgi:hypothetical protein